MLYRQYYLHLLMHQTFSPYSTRVVQPKESSVPALPLVLLNTKLLLQILFQIWVQRLMQPSSYIIANPLDSQ